MNEPTIAEEHFAKLIAYWHGQSPLYRNREGVLVTVATSGHREPTGWNGDNLDVYVELHWRRYIAAARAILEARS